MMQKVMFTLVFQLWFIMESYNALHDPWHDGHLWCPRDPTDLHTVEVPLCIVLMVKCFQRYFFPSNMSESAFLYLIICRFGRVAKFNAEYAKIYTYEQVR